VEIEQGHPPWPPCPPRPPWPSCSHLCISSISATPGTRPSCINKKHYRRGADKALAGERGHCSSGRTQRHRRATMMAPTSVRGGSGRRAQGSEECTRRRFDGKKRAVGSTGRREHTGSAGSVMETGSFSPTQFR
jgi:hypothetical protein